jgi:hypothetical protein
MTVASSRHQEVGGLHGTAPCITSHDAQTDMHIADLHVSVNKSHSPGTALTRPRSKAAVGLILYTTNYDCYSQKTGNPTTHMWGMGG